jgi:hypothetical protein
MRLHAQEVQPAGNGVGTDPYLENVLVSESGFMRAHLPPDYGVSAVPQTMGIPRLYERFVASTEQDHHASVLREGNLAAIVRAYGNPAIYPHRDFYGRAYSRYRNGEELQSVQFKSDLDNIDLWLKMLSADLEKAKQLVSVQH